MHYKNLLLKYYDDVQESYHVETPRVLNLYCYNFSKQQVDSYWFFTRQNHFQIKPFLKTFRLFVDGTEDHFHYFHPTSFEGWNHLCYMYVVNDKSGLLTYIEDTKYPVVIFNLNYAVVFEEALEKLHK